MEKARKEQLKKVPMRKLVESIKKDIRKVLKPKKK